MGKKICGGIWGVLKIAAAVIAWRSYVPGLIEQLCFTLLYADSGVDPLVLALYPAACLLAAGLIGLGISGLAQIYSTIKPNPLSKYSVLAIDILMIVSGSASYLTLFGLFDIAYFLPILIAIVYFVPLAISRN